MKKELKNYISKAYSPPSPNHKEEFLNTLNYPKVRWFDFLLSQLGYIRKRIWVASLLLYLTAILLGSLMDHGDLKLLWSISAILPYLAMLTITETARSAVYGLAELEMTSRYNLRSVLYARMTALGFLNLLMLIIILPILAGKIDLNVFKIGIYLLVPYLITSFLSYKIINRVRSKELSYYCAVLAAAVSCFGLLIRQLWVVIYQQQYFILWLAASVLLTIFLVKEIKLLINHSEEMLWNSYSTV